MRKPSGFLLWGWVGVLVLVTGSAHALSLGKLRGAALLGQHLEFTVGMQLADDEEAGGQCVAAEVVYGDVMVEASAISTRVQVAPNTGANVVVAVRRPVDEPVVTVYLRAGCRTPVSRKYVLLAELASETLPVVKAPEAALPSSVARPAADARVATVPVAAPMAARSSIQGKPVSTGRTTGRVPRAEGAVVDKVASLGRPAPAQDVQGRQSTQRQSAVSGGGPRLKLTPLELSQDWEPSLRISTTLSEPSPGGDATQRLQAQALWRALQTTPEEMLQESQQRARLEKELAELTQQSRTNQQAIAEMGASLRKAQESRMANPALFVLLGLLVVCGAVLALRARTGAASAVPWWLGRGKDVGDSQLSVPPSAHPADVLRRDEIPTGSGEFPGAATTAEFTSMPGGRDPTVLPSQLPTRSNGTSASAQAAVSSFRPSDFAHSVTGALRSINTQEMLDVRQQAEFFLALGQHDEATGLLQAALSHSSESNPHIYLDLLALQHRLGRKDDYERTREAFMERYTGLVPGFGDYGQPSKGLLEYPALVDVLVRVWDSRFALEYIEQCVVREPSDAPQAGFGLEAFRELLLLHAVRTQAEPEHPSAERGRPAFRVLPAAESPLGPSPTKLAWGTAAPLDLDLS